MGDLMVLLSIYSRNTSRLRPPISKDLLEKLREELIIPHVFARPSEEKIKELADLDVWLRKEIVITIFDHCKCAG